MRRDRRETRLHHNPKHFHVSEFSTEHTLPRFHIPVLHKHVVSRSKVNNNALQFEAEGRVRERRHLTGLREVVLIDAVQKCLFSSKPGSLYQAIIASTGRRLGSLDALKSRSTAIILHRTSGRDNPRHLYSHLSTHIHITKRACVSEASFA